MKELKTFYPTSRQKWRHWLEEHFQEEKEIWLIFPHKSSNKPGITYNDAVEEALCFNWIDSTRRSLDEENSIQRFTPRRPNSSFSQSNIERLKWLTKENMIHPAFLDQVQEVISAKFLFPKDILKAIHQNKKAWSNYQKFTSSYQRIRIAYIDGSRDRPEEFQKRLTNFIHKTAMNKIIGGYGGIEKYY
jgi:uncharacterized protein YdeI (YjbR/CyaY-like superfamily)